MDSDTNEMPAQTNGKHKETAIKYSPKPSSESHNNHATKSTSTKSNVSHRQRQNSPSTSMQNTSSTSNAFVALYPYKPQKSDELELKKGCK